MAKYTDVIRDAIIADFNAGDQPTEAQFTNWITRIQEGIDEHDHIGLAAGDGLQTLGSTARPLTLTMAGAGCHILDTGNNHDLIITPGTNLSADRILTLTTGDAARTITLSGNPTLADWFDQSVKQAASPLFADVFVTNGGTFGIAGNELLTVNAVGTFAFTGITGITVEDGDWLGIGTGLERFQFHTAGYLRVMGAYLGIDMIPTTHLEIQVANTAHGGMYIFSDGAAGYDPQIKLYDAGASWVIGMDRDAADALIFTTSGVGGAMLKLQTDGTLQYHALADITCASFKEYTDAELIKVIDLQPRKDGVYHKSSPGSKAFPHIDFAQVHDDIAVIARTDQTIEQVYAKNKKGEYEKTKVQYKTGDKYGIDFGSFVYAMAEHSVRLEARIKQLEVK